MFKGLIERTGAKQFTVLRLWKLSPWSLWINRYTYPLRLICVAGWLNLNGGPPIDLSQSNLPEEERES